MSLVRLSEPTSDIQKEIEKENEKVRKYPKKLNARLLTMGPVLFWSHWTEPFKKNLEPNRLEPNDQRIYKIEL